jgi:hypothetical protein
MLVIDTLGEWQVTPQVDVVLRLLCDMAALPACPMLVSLTRRPEVPVCMGLPDETQARHRHIILHHVERSVVNGDIKVYVKHTPDNIWRESCFAPDSRRTITWNVFFIL